MIVIMLALALQVATPPPTSQLPAPPTAQPPSTSSDAPTHPPEGAMHGLIAIFDMVCNRTFPDEQRLAKLDTAPNIKTLTPDQLHLYLKDDPGHGWVMTNGPSTIVITIEAPPFHACAVRMPHTDGAIDEAMWHQLVHAAETRAGGGFVPIAPRSIDVGDVRSSVIGDVRSNADGSAETFYLFRTVPIDPAKAPHYGVELRMVHQLMSANAR